MRKIYAGIGSRNTPELVIKRMKLLGKILCAKGFTLRSGGAEGADKAFEAEVYENKEIYLPWEKFNNNESKLFDITNDALDLAKKFHPNWNSLKETGKLYMARNCYQVLGKKLNEPVDFIICYTEDGKEIGGTSQAIRIAKYYDIPVFNIWNNENYLYLLKYLAKIDYLINISSKNI